MTAVTAIRKYFGEDRPVALKEVSALSKEERQELGRLCCEAMGEEFEPSPTS